MNGNISKFNNIAVCYGTVLKLLRVLFLELKHGQTFHTKHVYCDKYDIEIDGVFIQNVLIEKIYKYLNDRKELLKYVSIRNSSIL